MKDRPLSVSLEDNELVIRIGVDTLKIATEASPPLEEKYGPSLVEDSVLWAKTVLSCLLAEEEDGSTPVHRMLDEAFAEAIDQGGEGLLDV